MAHDNDTYLEEEKQRSCNVCPEIISKIIASAAETGIVAVGVEAGVEYGVYYTKLNVDQKCYRLNYTMTYILAMALDSYPLIPKPLRKPLKSVAYCMFKAMAEHSVRAHGYRIHRAEQDSVNSGDNRTKH